MIYDECEQKINTNVEKNKLNERKRELEASIKLDLNQIENLIKSNSKTEASEESLAQKEDEKKKIEKDIKNKDNKIEIKKKN